VKLSLARLAKAAHAANKERVKPRCDECGSTRDLRSLHGPCGKCAFKKESQAAFLDELQKIAKTHNYDRLKMDDKDEALDNIRINAHFFHLDNHTMNPAHRDLFKMIETAADSALQQAGHEKTALDMGAAQGHAQAFASRMGRGAAQQVKGTGRNIGGAIGAFATPVKSLQKGWNATWTPGGKPLHPAYKALMGYGLITGARDVAMKNDPSGRGHSRTRRALRFAGDQLGGVIAAPFGLTGGLVGSLGGAKVGDLAGAAYDKLRGYKARAQPETIPPKPQGLQE
jgi:hypothetical protein